MMFKYIDDDIVNMRKDDGKEAQFYWGDKVEIIDRSEAGMRVIAALGKASRTTPSVIFCTELAAFFKTLGYVEDPGKSGRRVFAFERTNFGIAHVRTDGIACWHSPIRASGS